MYKLLFDWFVYSNQVYSYAYYAFAAYIVYILCTLVMRLVSIISCSIRWIVHFGAPYHEHHPVSNKTLGDDAIHHLDAILQELRIMNAHMCRSRPPLRSS
jgi:hypothetical protein